MLEHSKTGLAGHRGALTEADDVTARLHDDLIRCVRSEQEVHHIPLCAQHPGSSGIRRHQNPRESGKQKCLCLPFHV